MVAEWIAGLGNGPVDVVGLSFGGMVAQHLTLDHPDLVRTLALLDTSPAFGLDGVTTPETWLASRIDAIRDPDPSAPGIEAVVAGLVGREASPEVRSTMVESMRAVPAATLEAACRALVDHDTRERLSRITAPVLVMVGEEDTETPPSYAEEIAARITGAELVVVPGAGHLLNLENPDAVNDRLRRHWLGVRGDRMSTEWRWVERFAAQLALCELDSSELCVVLSETTSRSENVEAAFMAAQSLGAETFHVVMPTPANPGPVPLRSTGTSLALQQNPAAIAALCRADFLIDCTVEGLLHAQELRQILESGTRVLMIANEYPEIFERMHHDADMARRVGLGYDMLCAASTMRVTSAAGTDLTVRLDGSFRAGSTGVTSGPGSIAHWPGGLVLAFPARNSVDGTIVLAPGDLNCTFKSVVRSPIRLTVKNDYVVAVDGDGVDARQLASYMAAFNDRDAYASSHLGLGHEPGGAVGLLRPLRQEPAQRGRGPRLRGQLHVLDRRERDGRPIHALPLRPADARLQRRPRRRTGGDRRCPAGRPRARQARRSARARTDRGRGVTTTMTFDPSLNDEGATAAASPYPGWMLADEGRAYEQEVSQHFVTAMSSLAATVCVVAAASPSGERFGITATAVCSLSTEPPQLVACVNRSSSIAKALSATGWFSVNILSGEQEHVAATFAGRTGLQGSDRFDDADVDPPYDGSPGPDRRFRGLRVPRLQQSPPGQSPGGDRASARCPLARGRSSRAVDVPPAALHNGELRVVCRPT